MRRPGPLRRLRKRDAEPPGLWRQAEGAPQEPLPLPAELPEAQSAEDLALEAWQLDTTQGELVAEQGNAAIAAALAEDRSPIPAPADREGYFGDRHLAYWLSGLGDALLVEQIAERRGRPLATGQRLLDFGCASGRVLRHFVNRHPQMDLVGVEINPRGVEWARRHLAARSSRRERCSRTCRWRTAPSTPSTPARSSPTSPSSRKPGCWSCAGSSSPADSL